MTGTHAVVPQHTIDEIRRQHQHILDDVCSFGRLLKDAAAVVSTDE